MWVIRVTRQGAVLWRLFAVFTGVVCCAAGILAEASAQPEIANGRLRAAFDAEHGGITAFTDLENGFEYLADVTESGGLWRIDLLPPGTPPVSPLQAQSFVPALAADGRCLEGIWGAFGIEAAPDLRVSVTTTLAPDAPASYWRIAISGLGALRVAAVRFPRVAAIVPQEGETLAAPVWMGECTQRAREMLSPANGPRRTFEWEYPGLLSVQCLAVYRPGGPGLYLACDDTSQARKLFAAFGDDRGGLGFEVAHLPESGAAGSYAPGYAVELSAFQGDWFTAAERYRASAPGRHFQQQSRRKTGVVPAWLLDTGAWVWNRGPSANVAGPALVLQERLGLPVSVFWHWWHGCAYDMGFPEYLPPREGAEPFQRAVATMHEEGLHAIVYMNQRLWGMTTPSWEREGAERFAVKGPDGTIRPEVYNTFTRAPCASMCMGTPFWRNVYAGIAEEVLNRYRVDGIYMDQACSSLACYDPAHGHPQGGGTYWMQGFQTLAADIRARAGHNTPVLAGEGCGEAWLPHLDLMLSLQVSMERYAAPGNWTPIPFFHAVHHDATVLYGNYSSLTMPPYDDLWPAETAPKTPLQLLDRKYATQFYLEQARAFAWGQQPTIANFRPRHIEERPEEMAYFFRLARVRAQALPYLRDGVMLGFPRLEVPEVAFEASRLSIYAGQGEAVKEFSMRHASALGAAWKHPSDGSVAVAFASIVNTPLNFEQTLDATVLPLPHSGAIHRITEAGRAQAGTFREGRVTFRVELKPLDACVYVFAPDS